jgi:glycosyltransferase involved in cell wall biosynthesis
LPADFDIVIDEVNAIPFFAPLWTRAPVVMLIHQLIREIWWYEARFPINVAGFIMEPLYLRTYRDVPVLTVSRSTRDDLRRLGFRGSITVVPQGTEEALPVYKDRSVEAQFLYVGRLVPSKRVSDAIRAFAEFCGRAKQGKLLVLGSGPPDYVNELVELAATLDVAERVTFLGHVSPTEKRVAMAQSHFLLVTSAREGWGLVVNEANQYGTPVIAYDVPGLRDSVRHYETGVLVPPSPLMLADAMVRVWDDAALYARLSVEAEVQSRQYSFDNTAFAIRSEMSSIVTKEITGSVNQDDGDPEQKTDTRKATVTSR